MTTAKNLPAADEAVIQLEVPDGSVLHISPEKIEEMRAEVRRRLDAKRRKRRTFVPDPPRYDAVFFEGVRELLGETDPIE